jgi:DNA-binding transcriptional regulator PaaX
MRINKGSLSELILIALEKSVDGIVRVEDIAYHSYIYARGYERSLPKSALSLAIRRLRDRELIILEEKNSDVLIKLTRLGRNYIPRPVFDEKDWDKKLRIVVFDIPESQRALRRSLRRLLKKWGFEKFQLSVWINKADVTEEFNSQLKKLGLTRKIGIRSYG